MKISRKRVVFQIGLHVFFVGHVLAYYFLDWTSLGGLDFQAFFHDFLSHGLLTAGAILALVSFLFTLVFGRIFCSWGCHFGAFQDAAAWMLRKLRWPAPHVKTRFLHWIPYALLIYIFLQPAVRAWFSDGPSQLFEVDLAANAPWATLPGWAGSIITFGVCGAGILLFMGRRGFCRFVCPYGAAFRALDPFASFRVRREKTCQVGCAGDPNSGQETPPCTLACPTAVNVHEEVNTLGAVGDVNCVRCHLCIEACPSGALGYGFRPLPILSGSAPKPHYTLSLSSEIVFLMVSALSFLAWDLTLAAHFLSATLALGEGFVAVVVLETLRRPDFSLGRVALRREGRPSFLGVTVLGLFVLSLVPLAQGGAFRYYVHAGDRALDRLYPIDLAGSLSAQSARPVDPASVSVSNRPELGARERVRLLQLASDAYGEALRLFPRHVPTRRKQVLVLGETAPRRALEAARQLVEDDPDPRSETLLRWVEQRAPAAGN